MIVDLHTHTACSFDCDVPLETMCESAVQKGVEILASTDHCDLTADSIDEEILFSADRSLRCAEAAQSEFSGRLRIIKGIELGQPMHNRELAEKVISNECLDFTLCSVHDLRGNLDFYYLDYTKEDVKSLLTAYFEEILETVRWNGFDSLAHLTYPLRYIEGDYGIKINLDEYSSQIDEILSTLAKNKKALEINTSGLGKKLNNTMPPESIVKRFRKLGGEYVTLGSDSHVPETIGFGIKEGLSLAKRCGFNEVTYFEKHIPVKIGI